MCGRKPLLRFRHYGFIPFRGGTRFLIALFPVLACAVVAASEGAVRTAGVQFLPHFDYQTGVLPISVAVGDLNGDGIPDLAVANDGSAGVSILLGNGSGTFAPVMQVSTGPSPYSVALADFNGDGNLDLVTSDYGANTASIMRGNGDGRSDRAPPSRPGTAPRPWRSRTSTAMESRISP